MPHWIVPQLRSRIGQYRTEEEEIFSEISGRGSLPKIMTFLLLCSTHFPASRRKRALKSDRAPLWEINLVLQWVPTVGPKRATHMVMLLVARVEKRFREKQTDGFEAPLTAAILLFGGEIAWGRARFFLQ